METPTGLTIFIADKKTARQRTIFFQQLQRCLVYPKRVGDVLPRFDRLVFGKKVIQSWSKGYFGVKAWEPLLI
jgi:hypothetical protein